MKKVCVFLGAKSGSKDVYRDAVIALGEEISNRKLTLVYGGSSLGMMGLLANTVKKNGSQVIGVIPKSLIEQEQPISILDDLHVVDTIQERKLIMQEMADFFVVMPGGIGTLDEAFEIWNAIKIGDIKKQIGFLNIDGYFDSLFSFVEHCQNAEFISSSHTSIPCVNANVQCLIDNLLNAI